MDAINRVPTTVPPPGSSYSTAAFTTRVLNVNANLPLIIELLLSLSIGIFGVGWLLIGENVIGILLLAGSIIFYLPLLVISYVLAYFSFGLSVLCTAPLAIGAIFLNASMLNKTIKRKRTLYPSG
ncbi:MAG: hypothetical protein NVS3B14_16020 [Ktedonobacteraceae bacterium]